MMKASEQLQNESERVYEVADVRSSQQRIGNSLSGDETPISTHNRRLQRIFSLIFHNCDREVVPRHMVFE